ncbi:Protocadherin Fat 3-like protein [Aix galericulata]|nr:Protocadherin Fat 3-like protein [Aix galericulata]
MGFSFQNLQCFNLKQKTLNKQFQTQILGADWDSLKGEASDPEDTCLALGPAPEWCRSPLGSPTRFARRRSAISLATQSNHSTEPHSPRGLHFAIYRQSSLDENFQRALFSLEGAPCSLLRVAVLGDTVRPWALLAAAAEDLGRLNYDEKNRYDLEILAVDRGMKLYGNNGVSSTAKLYVHIERINEHAPTINVVTHIPFPSDKEPTYAVVNIDDLDEGANGEIESVSIVAGDPLEQFFLTKEGKWMNEYKIKERKPIDWDSFPYGYNLTLQAKDKGSPQKFSAVKLVHIASPKKESIPIKFEKETYDVSINEFSPPGVVVAVIKLTPEPLGVEYRLSPSEDADYFKINPITGLITTARPLKIIEKDLYELEVYTNKGGDLKAQVTVRIEDANDHTPEFQQPSYSSFVNESVPVGYSVLAVSAVDKDRGENGYITYSIASLNSLPFIINQFTGIISTSEELDFESSPESYRFIVRASDWGSPYRHESEDSYSVNILESTSLGTEIIQVEARDKDLGSNGEVAYSVLTDTQQFAINSSTGVVYVADQLDRETKANYTLKIEARDKADSGHQQFSVVPLKVFLDDVNDCSPAFIPSSYNVKVLEDLPVGTVIAWLETHDPDLGLGGQVRYSLVNDYNGRFEIDKASGAIRLSKELDYEKQQFYNLTVRAKDKGRPVSLSSVSFVEVEVVDVNENLYTPYFPDFAVIGSVKENSRIGTSVLQVVARDEDSGRDGEIQYSIRDGSGLGRFSIDEETGHSCRLHAPSVLQRTGQQRERRSAHRCSSETPTSSSLSRKPFVELLDDPDHYCQCSNPVSWSQDCPMLLSPPSPQFPSTNFFLAKELCLRDEDMMPDCFASRPLEWSRIISWKSGQGELAESTMTSEDSGVIYTADILDRETTKSYWLTVYATDHGVVPLYTTIEVYIEVEDVNDNAPLTSEPIYYPAVMENSPKDVSVIQIQAQDPDSSTNEKLTYRITSGNPQNFFVINPKTEGVYRVLLSTAMMQPYSMDLRATSVAFIVDLSEELSQQKVAAGSPMAVAVLHLCTLLLQHLTTPFISDERDGHSCLDLSLTSTECEEVALGVDGEHRGSFSSFLWTLQGAVAKGVVLTLSLPQAHGG